MKIVSKQIIIKFEHNGTIYTRTEKDGDFSWNDPENDREAKLKRILDVGTRHHVKPTHKKRSLSGAELEKLYIQFLRVLKLERILKKTENDV